MILTWQPLMASKSRIKLVKLYFDNITHIIHVFEQIMWFNITRKERLIINTNYLSHSVTVRFDFIIILFTCFFYHPILLYTLYPLLDYSKSSNVDVIFSFPFLIRNIPLSQMICYTGLNFNIVRTHSTVVNPDKLWGKTTEIHRFQSLSLVSSTIMYVRFSNNEKHLFKLFKKWITTSSRLTWHSNYCI